ncbi:MAG: hypothetical protein AB8G23_19050 [Myxococcota bacterium]
MRETPFLSQSQPARFLTCALLASFLLVTSCARVPRDSEHRILVDVTSNPPGASFVGPGRTPYTTPAQIAIKEGYSLTIVLKKEGFEPYLVKLSKRRRPRNLDLKNPLFFGDIGFALKIGREAANSVAGANTALAMAPNPVNVDLTPSDGSLPDYPKDPEAVKAGDLSCTRPIELTQDCEGRWRPTPMRRIHVRGLDVRVAASATGQEILVLHDDVHPLSLGLFPEGYGPDACMRVMRQAILHGSQLLHLTAIRGQDVTHGCYLEFSDDVYEHLKSLTIEQ